MTQAGTKTQLETGISPAPGEAGVREIPIEQVREEQARLLRLLWDARRLFVRVAAAGFAVSVLLAFLIPKSYTSTAQLMPPDTQSTSGLAMMAAMASKIGGGLGSVAGDLLGMKSSGALFIGVLRSQTAQDRLVQDFHLQKTYSLFGKKSLTDARKELDENTSISEDRKSGIISIAVTDHSAQRAADLTNGYVQQLNTLIAELSTSAAHRERVFLEERLKVAKHELDDASAQLAQFSSKHNTLDIQTEGKAMLDAAGTLAGQLIAAQSELEGLRQIYTDNNPRVRSWSARVRELRKQLDKLGGTAPGGDNTVNLAVAPSAADSSAADPPGANSSAQNPSALNASTPDGVAPNASTSIPFPTIRSLPLLGAKYSDYYRRAKIEETVFEMLTEQYELAKVEEAKETPSVKVLDPGRVPEKKSFPPRTLIVFLGTFLCVSVCAVWILADDHWKTADPNDPRKILATEVVATLRARAHWFSRNGAGPAGQNAAEHAADAGAASKPSAAAEEPDAK